MRDLLTALCCVGIVMLSAQVSAESGCYEDRFLEDWEALLEEGSESAQEMQEFLNGLGEYSLGERECGSWLRVDGERRFRVAEGRYWVWRNGYADNWFRVGESSKGVDRFEKIGLLVRRLTSEGYTRSFRSTAKHTVTYENSSYFPIVSGGSLDLPPGFSDGMAGYRESTVLIGRLQDTDEEIRRLSEMLDELLEHEGKPTPAQEQESDTLQNEHQEFLAGKLDLPLFKLRPRADQARDPMRDASGKPQQAPTEDKGEQDAETQEGDATGEPEGSEAGTDQTKGDDGKVGGSSSEVGGSGGILPAGAPPWLTDLVRMVLAYFGIDQLTEGLLMALYMVAPDLLNDLAEFSAALSKGLANDDLDSLMKAARELYQLYNGLNNMAANFRSAEGFGEALQSVADSIEELPPSVRNELRSAMGKDFAKLTQFATAAESIDVERFGEMFSRENQQLLAQKVAEELESQGRKVVARELTKLAIQSLPIKEEAVARMMEGDFDKAGELIYDAAVTDLSKSVASDLGLEPAEVEQLMSGDEAAAAAIARRKSEEAVRDLARGAGLPDPSQVIVEAQRYAAMTTDEMKRSLDREVAEALSDQQRLAVAELRRSIDDPESFITSKLEQGGVPREIAESLIEGAPATTLVSDELAAVLGKRLCEQRAGKNDVGDPRKAIVCEVYKLTPQQIDKLEEHWAHATAVHAADIQRLADLEGKALRRELTRLARRDLQGRVERGLGNTITTLDPSLPMEIVDSLLAGQSAQEAAKAYASSRIERAERALNSLPVKLSDSDDFNLLISSISSTLPSPIRCIPPLDSRSLKWNDEELLAKLTERCLPAQALAYVHPEIRKAFGDARLLHVLQSDAPQQAIARLVETAVCQSQGILPLGVSAEDLCAQDGDAAMTGLAKPAAVLSRDFARRNVQILAPQIGIDESAAADLVESDDAAAFMVGVQQALIPGFEQGALALAADESGVRELFVNTLQDLTPGWATPQRLREWRELALEEEDREELRRILQESGLPPSAAAAIANGDAQILKSLAAAQIEKAVKREEQIRGIAERIREGVPEPARLELVAAVIRLATAELEPPWSGLSAMLARSPGPPARDAYEELVRTVLVHYGLGGIDWKSLPESVAECSSAPALGAFEGSNMCSQKQLLDSIADRAYRDVSNRAQDRVLNREEFGHLFRFEWADLASSRINRLACGEMGDCSLVESIAEKKAKIDKAVFQQLATGGDTFRFNREEIREFASGGGRRAAARWTAEVSDLVNRSLEDGVKPAAQPVQRIRNAVDEMARFDNVAEVDANAAAVTTLIQQKNMQYLALGDAINACMAQGLAKPIEGSLEAGCRRLARGQ